MEYYSAIKKNKIMLFARTWMKLEIIILSEISQTQTNHIFLSYAKISKFFLKRRHASRREILWEVEGMGEEREGNGG
jgi:hypothetical protein